jgi:hypothetical protein
MFELNAVNRDMFQTPAKTLDQLLHCVIYKKEQVDVVLFRHEEGF